jgi:large subunit ribosomal protein L29
MKASDLKTKTKDELVKNLLELKKEQMEARFQLSAGQLEDTSKVRKLRRTVARIQTQLNAPVEAKETKAKPAAKAKAAPKKTTKKDTAA